MSLAVTFFDVLLRLALSSFLLLAIASAAVLFVRQPARRIRVIQWTLAGLVALPCLLLVPGYPRLAVLPLAAGPLADEPAASEATLIVETGVGAEMLVAPEAASVKQRSVEPLTALMPEQHVQLAPESAPVERATERELVEGRLIVSELATIGAPGVRPTELESLQYVDEPLVTVVDDESLQIDGLKIDEATSPASPRLPRDYRAWIVAAYGTGVLVMAGWSLVGLAAVWRLMRSVREAPPECRILLRSLGGAASQRVALVVSSRVAQPCALVWRRTTIVLPEQLVADADPQALRWALAHEWSHVERGDLVAWNASGLLRSFYFYQPLVWRLRGQLQLCQDYVADAAAARWGEMPEDYAEFLTTSSFTRPTLAAGLGIGGRISDLRRRVIMLVERRRPLESKSPRAWNLVVMPIAVLVLGIAAALAPQSRLEAGGGRLEEEEQGSAAEQSKEASPPVEGTAPAEPAEAAEPKAPVATPAPAAKPAAVIETDKSNQRTRPIPSQPAPQVAKPSGPRKIRPGDVLKIDLQDNFDSLNTSVLQLLLRSGTELPVDEEGRVSLGSAYGRMELGGKTLEESERRIGDTLLIHIWERLLVSASDPDAAKASLEQLRKQMQINVRLSFVNPQTAISPGVPQGTFIPTVPATNRYDAAPKTAVQPVTPKPHPAPSTDRTRRIQPGDRLVIAIQLESNGTSVRQEYPREVEPNGTIAPLNVIDDHLVVHLVVGGRTVPEVEKSFAAAIKKVVKTDAAVKITRHLPTNETPPVHHIGNVNDAPSTNRTRPVEGVGAYSQVAAPPVSTRNTYIRPGDNVSVEAVFEPVGHKQRRIAQRFDVDPDGEIALGAEYGRCKIGGLTVAEAEKALVDKLSEVGKGVKVQIVHYPGPQTYPSVRLQQPAAAEAPFGPTVSPYVRAIQSDAAAREGKIQPGDLLSIELLPEEANKLVKRLSVVEPDGKLALGVAFGRVKVAGKTLSEAELLVKAVVAMSYRDPSVQITHADATNVPAGFGLPIIPSSDDEATRKLQQEIDQLKATIRDLRKQQSSAVGVPSQPSTYAAPSSYNPSQPPAAPSSQSPDTFNPFAPGGPVGPPQFDAPPSDKPRAPEENPKGKLSQDR